jgi:hydrogenase 3 maturation protease
VSKLLPSARIFPIDAGTAPENYLGKIAALKPDTILIVDAVHMDRHPGHHEILARHELIEVGFTTHDMPPTLLVEYLEQETGAGVYLLGVQPKSVAFGESISPPVREALDKLAATINEAPSTP